MKKIQTLFKRIFNEDGSITITEEVTPGLEYVLDGGAIPTIKYDGACCAVIDGIFYKRFDAKKGKTIPENAIPCQEEADPVTGHFPHWVPVDGANKADKWFWKAFEACYDSENPAPDGTYEAVGPHFNDNNELLVYDTLIPHGQTIIPMTEKLRFDIIRSYLQCHNIEGIVFWANNEPVCKIKRSDFGFEWGEKK